MTPQLSQAIGRAQTLAYELRFINDAVLAGLNDLDRQYTLSTYAPLLRSYIATLGDVLNTVEAAAQNT